VLSSSTPRTSQPRPRSAAPRSRAASPGRSGSADGLRVRHLARGAEDGYHCGLVPGLHSSADAQSLAAELAFASSRLAVLEQSPPGLYAAVSEGQVEERTWLAFLIAYIGPLEEGDPFVEIERVRTSWASGELPALESLRTGPRTAHDPVRGSRTLAAYAAWARRAGSQAAAFTGEAGWTPQRRFERTFERLALPGLHRDARFELLSLLGRLGVYELAAPSLKFGGDNEVTVAAKRALGIADPLLLDRRAAELARACGIPLEAIDLALYNWGTGTHVNAGAPAAEHPEALERIQAALGLR